jgi:nucleoside-diphosphate-sugar epimerase
MNTLFITGASGFIGRHLIHRLSPSDYKNIYCLSRTACNGLSYSGKYDNVQFLRSSLFDSESYTHHLAKSDIVIHLAAITGKAKAEEYFNINTKGTEFLLKQCIKSGVRKFLYISSIAVKFKDIKNYPYAQSKLQAEECVTASGMLYTILRPTIVIGDGSPILMSLLKIAKAPIIPIFGDGSSMIQPIFIEDLISHIIHIIKNDVFDNEILDLGGAEKISIENFIKILHKLAFNGNPRFIHVPIHSVGKILEFMEKYFFTFLPFTAGQLSSFSNDGTIDRNWLFDRYLLNMKNVDEMLEFVLSPVMKISRSKESLKQECIRFTEYLINCKPNAYIEKKYLEAISVITLKIIWGSLTLS